MSFHIDRLPDSKVKQSRDAGLPFRKVARTFSDGDVIRGSGIFLCRAMLHGWMRFGGFPLSLNRRVRRKCAGAGVKRFQTYPGFATLSLQERDLILCKPFFQLPPHLSYFAFELVKSKQIAEHRDDSDPHKEGHTTTPISAGPAGHR